MAKWTEYTKKEALKDNDELMILDTDGKANKRTLMNKVWDYVVDKMTSAVIAKLTTTDKTIIGALNELNSNSSNFVFVEATHNMEGESPNIIAQHIIDNQLPEDGSKFFFVSFTAGSRYRMIVQKYFSKDYASYILFGYANEAISYHRKTVGKWI